MLAGGGGKPLINNFKKKCGIMEQKIIYDKLN